MIERFFVWWEKMRTGLWPIPAGMMLLAVLLYNIAIGIDATAPDETSLRDWWLYSGSGDDARNLLSTLVAAIITMSSVVFSITVVALSLAANQFGSRLVRTYMADIRTKFALGLFAMTIVYCLLALRSVQKDMPPDLVPHVAVSLGLLLGLVCVLALLFFLHLVARSIVADEVIRRVSAELEEAIAGLPPLQTGLDPEEAPEDVLPGDFEARSVILPSRDEGYVQAIDYNRLVAAASRHDVQFQLGFRAGAFMCKDGWLGAIYPNEAVTPEIADAIRGGILIGARRTPSQDLEFTLRHLVDIALRALSPGINDANTALVVIDHLRGALSRLMGKELPTAIHRDQDGTVRVVGKYNGYAGVLDAALHQIRQSAATQPAVVIALLSALGRIAEHVRLPRQRDALLHHARLVAAAGLRRLDEPRDRADIEEAFTATERKLQQTLRRGLVVTGKSEQADTAEQQ